LNPRAFADIPPNTVFQIEGADRSVIFVLDTGHSRTQIPWQQTFTID
jgi:hypothetical protein